MTEIEQLTRQNQRTFVFVCFNFAMLLVLFFGLGYVIWQSTSLISAVKQDLQRAEQALAQLQERVQNTNMDDLLDQVVANARDSIGQSVKTAVGESGFTGSLATLAARVDQAQTELRDVSDGLKAANEKLQKLDTEQLAQLVSYNLLQGLGEGFYQAAEASKPATLIDSKRESTDP